MRRPLRLGLTGGIGSGKSTVANILGQHGAGLIDADAISRSTTASQGAAIPAIRATFGETFIDPNGALHRERMRELIFKNPQAKKTLENIIHPLVAQSIGEQAQHLTRAGKPCLVFDIPLLVESGHWRTTLDRVFVVDCDVSTQVQRVCSRSDMTADAVLKIITAQASRPQRLAAADVVLYNDGLSIHELAAQVALIAPQFGL